MFYCSLDPGGHIERPNETFVLTLRSRPVSFDVYTENGGALDRFCMHLNNVQPVVVNYNFMVY